MKQSEIEIGTDYILDPAIIDRDREDCLDWGYIQAFRTLGYAESITGKVIAKGRKLHQWRERNDAVLVEFTGLAATALENRDDFESNPTQVKDGKVTLRGVVLARRVIEPVAVAEQREADRKARKQERQDVERQRLADRAQGIHQAYIGQLIEETEREASRAADKLKSELEHLIQRAQENLKRLDEGTTVDRERRSFWGGLAPAEEGGGFPYLNDIFLKGALRDVGEAYSNYNDYRAQHARWQQAINAAESAEVE